MPGSAAAREQELDPGGDGHSDRRQERGNDKASTSMLGLMQQRPLLISSLHDYAERHHASRPHFIEHPGSMWNSPGANL
jgi:hypothetical protein